MGAKSVIKTSVNVTETRTDEGARKKISCAKRALGRTLHQSRKHRHASSGRGGPVGLDPCPFLLQTKLCPQILRPI